MLGYVIKVTSYMHCMQEGILKCIGKKLHTHTVHVNKYIYVEIGPCMTVAASLTTMHEGELVYPWI